MVTIQQSYWSGRKQTQGTQGFYKHPDIYGMRMNSNLT